VAALVQRLVKVHGAIEVQLVLSLGLCLGFGFDCTQRQVRTYGIRRIEIAVASNTHAPGFLDFFLFLPAVAESALASSAARKSEMLSSI
jgi:hypothetical protein